jgi:hypothetical protein
MNAQSIKLFLESFSLGTGALVVAVVSLAVVWLLSSVLPLRLGALWVAVVPLGLAYCLYWLPVWLGSDPLEYGAWQFLVVGAWFLSGFIPSAILLRYLRKRRGAIPK